MRWKCLFLQVRPSVYWWVIISILKGLFLSLTTVIFDSPMAQTVYLGTGLLVYFLAVFWFLPWRTSTLLCLDVLLHYVLAVLCLLMPFFVPASATELQDVALLFLLVSFIGAIYACGCVLGVLRTQSPNAQRAWRLTYEKDARKFVQVFQVMNDEKVMKDVLDGLGDVDLSTSISVMKLLSVELLGNRETGRLIWRSRRDDQPVYPKAVCVRAKVTMQMVHDRGLVVIMGKAELAAYNLKDYVAKHPGGSDILLGMFGPGLSVRIFEVEFETMRHSPVSHLFVGAVDSHADAEDIADHANGRKRLSLTGGRQHSRANMQENSWWDVGERGFLPTLDPIKQLPAPWDQLISFCELLPGLNAQMQFRRMARTMLQLPETEEDLVRSLEMLSEGELECLHSVLGYICLAFVHAPVHVYENNTVLCDLLGKDETLTELPDWLGLPWLKETELFEHILIGLSLVLFQLLSPRGGSIQVCSFRIRFQEVFRQSPKAAQHFPS
ncbi:unnamed protein product [Symbiodinium pilosum]|uniref:Cytochrome b5 heme-binding domain-containing protein n=1 Tax=Symbiodinium pilosum TaxID=2952 RepID=A0A812VZZ1_SYMPI|nr:unnamed protein product [Symbiodinium pilosum]